MAVNKKPLMAYLKVQEHTERELFKILSRAAAAAERDVRNARGAEKIGAVVRRDQMRLVQSSLLRQQAAMWKRLESTVKAGQAEAAAAAVESTLEAILPLLSKAGVAIDMASLKATASRGADLAWARLAGLSKYSLAESVYGTRSLANGQVERVIYDALARGLNWRELAAGVKDLIDPRVRGGVSYAAQRLARTELNNAFHATAVKTGINNPYITGQLWNLSSSHPKADECNDYADSEHYTGGEPGVFLPDDVPPKPHPNCLCFITAQTPDEAAFQRMLITSA